MSLKKNVIANYSGNLMAVLINFLLVPLYLRYLSVEEYGLIAFFGTLSSAFVILDMGLGLTVNKEVATSLAKGESKRQTSDIIRSFELVYWGVAFVIGLFVLISANWIASYWLNVETISDETLTLIVSLMGLALLFRWPISFYNNVLSGFQKMVKLNVIKIIVLVLNILCLYLLFEYYKLKISGFFKFLTLLYIVNITLLIFNVWNIKNIKPLAAKFNLNILKKSKRYILGIGVFSILGTVFILLDKIVISKFFLATDLGHYSLMSMMTLALLQFVYPISSALFPKFVENYTKNKKEESFLVFRKGYQIIIVIVFSLSSTLLLFKNTIILLWTQNEEVTNKSIIYFTPLLLGTLLYTLHILIVSIYTSLGRTKPINYLYGSVFVMFLFMLSIAVSEKNMLWVAYSWGSVNGILLISSFFLGRKLLGAKNFKTFFLKDFLVASLLLGVVLLLNYSYSFPKFSFFQAIIVIPVSLFGFLLIYSSTSSYIRSYIVNLKNNYIK